ncbi:hypothetical protein D9M70_557950 [compost metagenome]
MIVAEHPTDIGVVVEADDGLALDFPNQLGHLLVLLEAERHPVAFGLPVRRVAIKQSVRPVVTTDALGPAQVLDVGVAQTQVSSGERLFDPQQIEAGRLGGGCTVALAVHPPAERTLLQIVEPGRPLNISQGLRSGLLQPPEHLTATQRPLELADELLQVVLYDSVQIDQVAVDVVEHLNFGR